MSEIVWPSNPILNQLYTSPSGVTWIWNGYAWDNLGRLNIGLIENGNGTTANGLSIDLGGDLTSDVFINGLTGTSSMYIGSGGPDNQLGTFSVGTNNGISLFNYDNNLINSNFVLGNGYAFLSSGNNGTTSLVGGNIFISGLDNRKFAIYLSGGIAPGSGESFTINGTTFTEGIDFIGQNDNILDAETIANLDYSIVSDFISVEYQVGFSDIIFNFNTPATVSISFTNGYLNENQYSTQVSATSSGLFLTVGNTGLVIGRSDGVNIFNDFTSNLAGIQYGGNYDATLVDDSLVPKRYVDDAIIGASLTGGNGITIGATGTGNTIDLGGTLTQPITIISGSSTETLDIGGNTIGANLAQTRINSISYQGNHLTTYDGTGVGTQININPGEFSVINNINPATRTQIINGASNSALYFTSNKIFRLYLDTAGIAPGSGESFTINGTTFTEGIDFIGQGNALLDAATIAGLNYTGIANFVSVTDEGSGSVKFTFSNPVEISETLNDGYFLVLNWQSNVQTNNDGIKLEVRDTFGIPYTSLLIGDSETIFTDNSVSPKGIQYGANYDATLVDDSLVPKRYVDAQVSNSYAEETFTPTTGQTIFTLANTLIEKRTLVFVNGLEQLKNIDYTIIGNILTWLNTDFSLENTDRLTIYYNK